MDTARLAPILNKESILKTASARELEQAPQDVLNRYEGYASTHVPLGDTTNQVNSLRRVITQNKHCAVGTIVGPYGYGKTSTAVHLWSELRGKQVLSVPPFQWNDLQDLLDAVFHWTRFEFSLGPKAYVDLLDKLYGRYHNRQLTDLQSQYDAETIRDLSAQGLLRLGTKAADFVSFASEVCQLCIQAGYQGLAIFTDELQATLAAYQPSRDQFYADLFEIVKEILGLAGQWTLVMTMDDGTEGIIARDRSDMLQRMQRSALYFRVRDVYNRREYPTELWSAFEERFQFDGDQILPVTTLDAIGQIAAREDLGAGPRMVTHALSLAVKHFGKTNETYSPLDFVNDFLEGEMVFDQRGKFISAVKKALANPEIRESDEFQDVVKLLAAYPMGCAEGTLAAYGLLDSFQSFPPLARQELILRQAGGYILRYLAEQEVEPEQIEQRLTKEFVNRYAPNRTYAERAAEGFLTRIIGDQTLADWKVSRPTQANIAGIYYDLITATGTFDTRYPDRLLAVTLAAVEQSRAPIWRKANPDAQIEIRFELNHNIAASEPNRLLVSEERPDIAIFQLNLSKSDSEAANRILPDFLHEYYSADQLTPHLVLALIQHLDAGSGERPDDRQRVNAIVNVLRQYVLQLLLNDQIETVPADYASSMVGTERIKDLFRQMVRVLFPDYQTLITNKRWKDNLQQYNYALQTVTADDGISIARGRRSWITTKERVADAFRIPGRRLTNLESLLDVLDPLILKEQFSGRTSESEVVLRFQLHVLEAEWLEKLDSSSEIRRYNGFEVPALPGEILIREAQEKGYTEAEIEEVLRLLVERKFVDWDEKHNMIYRVVDDISDLYDAVVQQLDILETNVRLLQDTVPDFDPSIYHVNTLRSDLQGASERDQIEDVKAKIRQYNASLSVYTSSRLTRLEERLKEKQHRLFELVQDGVPKWLADEMPAGPFHDALEKQRQYISASYTDTLNGLRVLREESVQTMRKLPASNADAISELSNVLRQLDEDSAGALRKLNTYEDYRDDLEKWRQVSDNFAKLKKRTGQIEQKYAFDEFGKRLNELITKIQSRMEAQPFDAMGMWKIAHKHAKDINDEVTEWQASRRQDFELRCREYQQTLAQAGMEVDLSIPFDADNPTESYGALSRIVRSHVETFLVQLTGQLRRNLQTIRYGLLVQELPLGEVEKTALSVVDRASHLLSTIETVPFDDLASLQTEMINPLAAIRDEGQDLRQHVMQAMQKREPDGDEVRLMTLLHNSGSGEQVDLRSLILSMLEQQEEEINMEQLMNDLQSLFQKNQISLTVGILH